MLENEDKRTEQIERYLEGMMTPEEISSFEKELLSDSELKKEFDLYKTINNHFQGISDPISKAIDTTALETYFKSDEAKSVKESLERAGKVYASKKKSFNFPRMMAASVIGLMICISGYFLLKDDNLYNEYYSSSDLPSLVSRGSNNNILEQTVVAFNNKEYNKVIELSSDYTTNATTINANVFVYSGLAYSELGETSNAIQEFNKLVTSDSIDSSKGLWFMAITYLKNDNQKKTKQVLKKIVEDQENFNYKKAVSLLEELD